MFKMEGLYSKLKRLDQQEVLLVGFWLGWNIEFMEFGSGLGFILVYK
jgi:hypothetical protein